MSWKTYTPPEKVHTLKTWPRFFRAVVSGEKKFEIRKNDRDFQVNDLLQLLEWDPETEKYTGRECIRRVSYLTECATGIEPGYVVMGIVGASALDVSFNEAITNSLRDGRARLPQKQD